MDPETTTPAAPVEAAAEPAPKKKLLPFKVGADPEYLIFLGGKQLNAQRLIGTYVKADPEKGVFPGQMGWKFKEHGEIGWDGASSTGEIRPAPSNDPYEVAENITKLLGLLYETAPFLDLTSLSISSPIGGHIHLDILKANGDAREEARMTRLISTFLLPLSAGEHTLCAANRIESGGYGRLSDHRVGQAGVSARTYEVRGPSAEWITTPKLAAAVLSYMGVVWHEINKRGDELAKDKVMLKNLSQVSAIQDLFLSDYRPIKAQVVAGLGELIKTFELYETFKEEVDYVLNYEKVFADKRNVGWNLVEGHGFEKGAPKTLTKKTLTSDAALQKRLKDVNMEHMKSAFGVYYNNDYNVALYSQAIAERIAAFRWKLKNEYFLYGLKKGVEGFLVADAVRPTEGTYIVPSKGQTLEECGATLEKVAGKVYHQAQLNTVRIDPKSGHARAGVHQTIMIGLPYQMRVEKDINPLISIIFDLEHGDVKRAKLSSFPEPEMSPKAEGAQTNQSMEAAENLAASTNVAQLMKRESGDRNRDGENLLNNAIDELVESRDTPSPEFDLTPERDGDEDDSDDFLKNPYPLNQPE